MTPEFIKTHNTLRLSNQLEEMYISYVESDDFTCLSGDDRGELTKNMLDMIGFFRMVKAE